MVEAAYESGRSRLGAGTALAQLIALQRVHILRLALAALVAGGALGSVLQPVITKHTRVSS